MSRALDADARRRLRSAIADRHPWVGRTDVGPRSVEAGECDRCGLEARLVAVCGPVPWEAIGRRCARVLGEGAWCDGHAAEAHDHLRELAALPDEADTVARLWWVATGEVRVDGHRARAMATGLPGLASVAAELDRGP